MGTTRRWLGNRALSSDKRGLTVTRHEFLGQETSHEHRDCGHQESEQAEIVEHQVIVVPVVVAIEGARPGGQEEENQGSDPGPAQPSPQEITMPHGSPWPRSRAREGPGRQPSTPSRKEAKPLRERHRLAT